MESNVDMMISFFVGSLGCGGAERVLCKLANYYAKSGYRVEIVLLLDNAESYYPLEKDISIVDLSLGNGSYTKNSLRWLRSIRNYVIRQKPDRIVSFFGRINALVLTATVGLRIPIVISERSDPKRDGRGFAMLQYCNTIYRRASAIVFQTYYQQSCFSRKLSSKSYIIPNPVSVSIDRKEEENCMEVSTAGRLTHLKRHDLLIDAIELVSEKYPNVRCEIYGEGGMRNELDQRIIQKNLSNNVHLAGNKTDIHQWIDKSSIFVMTSEYEGMSNALIEAMMLGKACITTDYPGADEVIKDEVNGIIVPRGDSRSLADAIIKLISDEELRKKLSNNAMIFAEQYKTDYIIKKWDNLITKCSYTGL